MHTTSILRKDQFFDSGADCARVYSEDVLLQLERLLMKSGISYSAVPEYSNPLLRMLNGRRGATIVRVNGRDMEDAMEIADGIRGVEVIGVLPEEDWVPSEAKKRREKDKVESARFRRDWQDEYDDEEEYGEYERRQA